VFVTWVSIWKFHCIATKKNLFRYKKLRDFDTENVVSHHETDRPKVSRGGTPPDRARGGRKSLTAVKDSADSSLYVHLRSPE
jgi:hypothetical protein